jgi:hypothetical protein
MCIIHEDKYEINIKFQSKNMKERAQMGYVGTEDRVILK